MKSTLTVLALMLTTVIFSQSNPALQPAWDAYNSNEFQRCLSLLEDQRGSEALFLEGNCLQKLGMLSKALARYDSAEASGCDHAQLHLNRGICRLSLGMTDPAEQDLMRYLRDNPQDERALYYMGQLEYARFADVASMDYLERCLNVNPNNTDALFLQGGNYVEMEKFMLAADAFREVLSIEPEHYAAQKALAQVLLYQDDASSALVLLEDLEPLTDSERAEILFFQAEAHYVLHHSEQACELWAEAANLGDKDAGKNVQNICIKGKDKLKRKRLTRMNL